MKSLTDLAAQYTIIKGRRAQAEVMVNDLKAQEADLKQSILLEMNASNVQSVKIEGVGMLARRTDSHYEISNIENLALQQFKAMIQAAKEGRPLQEGLLLQRRISKDQLELLVSSTGMTADEAHQAFGVRRVEKPNLSVTKRS